MQITQCQFWKHIHLMLHMGLVAAEQVLSVVTAAIFCLYVLASCPVASLWVQSRLHFPRPIMWATEPWPTNRVMSPTLKTRLPLTHSHYGVCIVHTQRKWRNANWPDLTEYEFLLNNSSLFTIREACFSLRSPLWINLHCRRLLRLLTSHEGQRCVLWEAGTQAEDAVLLKALKPKICDC